MILLHTSAQISSCMCAELITAIFGLFDDSPWLFGLPQNSAVEHIALWTDKLTVNAVNGRDVQQIEDMVLCDGKVKK